MSAARWFFRGVLGLSATSATVAVGTAVPTPAQAARPGSDLVDDSIPGETAVFARFSDLDEPATQARLAELLESRSLSDRLLALSARLADGRAKPAELERLVLPLIAGRTPEDADVSLAAVMLDQYLTYLRAGLDQGDLGPSDVFAALIARDALLTTAALGTTTERRHIRR